MVLNSNKSLRQTAQVKDLTHLFLNINMHPSICSVISVDHIPLLVPFPIAILRGAWVSHGPSRFLVDPMFAPPFLLNFPFKFFG